MTLPPLIARLMEPEAPAPAPAAPVEKPAAAAPREAPPPKKAEKPAPVVSTPQPADVPPPPVEAPAAPPSPPPVAAFEPRPDAPVSSVPSAAALQPAQAPESLLRDRYRLELLDEARRHKRYPPLARENNWQGDVLVGVAVAANGRPSVTLKGSSGYEVLDRQALEMFRQAARAVPVPPALRGKEFALDVRAVYGLEE